MMVRSQTMTRNGPEEQGKSSDKENDDESDPYGSTEKHSLHIRLADPERSERCCFRLTEENEDRVESILMRHKEENSDSERDE